MFWSYVTKRQKEFATQSDPRRLAITSQVWLIISVGWFISIFLGYVNVYIAYASWVLLPNLVGIWGNYKRRTLQMVDVDKGSQHDKKRKR